MADAGTAQAKDVACVETGARMGHTADIKVLVEDLGEFKPTFILSVPRVFEKVYNSAEQKAAAGGKSAIFQRAAMSSARCRAASGAAPTRCIPV